MFRIENNVTRKEATWNMETQCHYVSLDIKLN